MRRPWRAPRPAVAVPDPARLSGSAATSHHLAGTVRDPGSPVAHASGDNRLLPPEVVRAWTMLRESGGTTNIAELADEVGWSTRRLANLFTTEIGLTPKAAARVIRFDRARRPLQQRVASPGPLDLAQLATDHGDYDQPHFYREFAALSGCSPAQWLTEELRNIQARFNTGEQSWARPRRPMATPAPHIRRVRGHRRAGRPVRTGQVGWRRDHSGTHRHRIGARPPSPGPAGVGSHLRPTRAAQGSRVPDATWTPWTAAHSVPAVRPPTAGRRVPRPRPDVQRRLPTRSAASATGHRVPRSTTRRPSHLKVAEDCHPQSYSRPTPGRLRDGIRELASGMESGRGHRANR
jgi:AraC-like DNA-binding protein